MLSDAEIRGLVSNLFPMRGDRFEVAITEDERPMIDDDGALAPAVRLITYDEDGQIRDIKEQTFVVLPARHRNARGVAYLASCRDRIASMSWSVAELTMPRDLFAAAILDVPELAAHGFARVLGDPRARRILDLEAPPPALLASVDPERRPRPPVLANPELEARIAERPDDRDLYAVYGDWLADRGDPRGELIAVQLARATRPDDAQLRMREADLLAEYAYEWLEDYAWLPACDFGATWRYGFVHGLRIGASDDAPTDDSVGDVGLGGVAALPSIALLRELVLAPHAYWDESVFETIGAAAFPSGLVHLAIETPEFESLGDLEPAYRNLARLRELRIESRAMELGAIELPALRSLELVTRGLTVANLASIRAARCPELARLVLWIGDYERDDCDIALDDLEPIFAGDGIAAVRELGLCGREPAALLDRLVDAPVLRQLEILDLAGSFLDDAGVAFLTEHAAAFAHLRELRIPRMISGSASEVGQLRNVVVDDRFVPVYE